MNKRGTALLGALLVASNCAAAFARPMTHAEWTALWHPPHPGHTRGGRGGTQGGGTGGGTQGGGTGGGTQGGGGTGGGTQGGGSCGGGTTGGTQGGNSCGLTVSRRIWDPGNTGTATYNVVNVGGALAVSLTKTAPFETNSAADAEVNGATGMTVTSVSYDFQNGADSRVGWDIMTSDGVDHVAIVTYGTEGTVQNLGNGWSRRTMTPNMFEPPITANETIAANNGNDVGYNDPQYAGNVSAVELIYNRGTSNGSAGTALVRNITINSCTANLSL